MIIDAHVHLFYNVLEVPPEASVGDLISAGERWFEHMLNAAEAVNIDKFCLLGEPVIRLSGKVHQEAGANGLLMHIIDKYPDKILGYIRINPNNTGEAIAEMEQCFKNQRVVGVKIGGSSGCPASLKADSPAYEPVMKKLIELGGIMLMHAWDKTTGNYEQESTPFEVAEMARKFPGARIHMAHLNGAGYEGVLAIEPYKNIFVDTSGSYPEAGFLEWAVEVLGPERIVFGSDATGRDFCVQLAKVSGADLAQDVKDAILGGNMAAILEGRI